MTSLFSRLQKLNKEATPSKWWLAEVHNRPDLDARVVLSGDLTAASHVPLFTATERDAALIVECRNSLPAVLNLIEAAQEHEDCADWYRRCLEGVQDRMPVSGLDEAKAGYDAAKDKLNAALEPFVSGQEEQP